NQEPFWGFALVKWHRREELSGKEVIDHEAKRIGIVKDLAYSTDGKLALLIQGEGGDEGFLPFGSVEKIGDVIFVKPQANIEPIPMRTCPSCKLKVPEDAKFCPRCGKRFEGK
ncbi:MAG: PRC-barrel domain-containing protein, partial [Candidatus Bathyarchaeia archaeon]